MRLGRLLSVGLLALLPVASLGCSADVADETDASEEALRQNIHEAKFVRLDLLSRAEEAKLDAFVAEGVLAERHGAMVVVYPDARLPEAGDAVAAAVKSGRVRTLAFAGMPMSLKGSVNVAKYVAAVNREPVVAVHVGYGNMPDNGLLTYGPRAFYIERPLNASLTPYDDDAIEPALAMLASLDARRLPELRLVGYCLGAYKVANLVRRLGEKRPDVVAKTELVMLGTGVRLPEGTHGVYQRAGNLDQFGRINSNEIDDVDIVAGADHYLRDDAPDGMRLPTWSEVEERRALRAFVLSPASASYADAKAAFRSDAALARAVAGEVDSAVSLRREADARLTTYVLDDMHRAKLDLWGARARLAVVAARALARGAELPEDAEMRGLAAEVETKRAALESLARGRSVFTDQIEYAAWRNRQLFR